MVLGNLPCGGLAGGLESVIGREASLDVGLPEGQIIDVNRFFQLEFVGEVSAMHGGGNSLRAILAGSEPGKAMFCRHTLGNRKGPMDRVQLGVSLDAVIVADVCPAKGTIIPSKVPFPFLLQELKPDWLPLFDGKGVGATRPFRNAAVGLYLRGVGAVIRGELIAGLD